MSVEFGRYQLLRKIGSGGMGQVFLARSAGAQGFEKLLVIKRILPHLAEDEEFLAMFFDEARIAARLNHPNLAQIFDLGEVAGSHYLAMEYVAGEDVRRLDRYARANNRPLPLGVCCRIIADAAAGLDYAHKATDAHGQPLGLVHRDVSPQNILVGFDGAVKLIDFGVAKAAGRSQQTASGMLKGKYPYMSPEQSLGQDLDRRSDVFSLGTIFWEVLTGKRLFKGDSNLTTMRLVAACQVPEPSKVGGPEGLDALVLKALARNAEDRYPDAAAFQLAIEDFIIERRLQASTAHLVSFLGNLYKERIATEADPETLDQLHGPLDPTETGPGSSPSSSMRAGHAAELAQREPSRAAAKTPSAKSLRPPDGTQQVVLSGPPPPPARGRWVALIGVGLIVGGMLGAVTLLLLRRGDAPPPNPLPPIVALPMPPHPPPLAEDLTSVVSHSKPEPVVIRLVTDPPGATVEIGGREQPAHTPLDFPVTPDAPPVLVVLSLPGFEPAEAHVTSHDAPQLSVALKKKSKPKRNPVNLGIKTGR